MDIMELKPLIVTVVDESTGEVSFSRDPSNISAAINLFEKMEYSGENELTDAKGVSFTLATMYGDFLLGEFLDDRVRVAGIEHILLKDYSTDVRLLAERVESESKNIREVPRNTILSINPGMTYRKLIDLFGETLNTSTQGSLISYLYKYENRPFYVSYDRETDSINIDGEALIRSIIMSYNLGDALTPPVQLSGGHLQSYLYAFEKVINQCMGRKSISNADELLIDTGRLVHLSDEERSELKNKLEQSFNISVNDTGDVMLSMDGAFSAAVGSTRLIVWVDSYTYISDKRLGFTAAARIENYPIEKMSVTISR